MESCRWITLAELEERHIEWRRLAAGSEPTGQHPQLPDPPATKPEGS